LKIQWIGSIFPDAAMMVLNDMAHAEICDANNINLMAIRNNASKLLKIE
jgi:hypothetical protein